MKKTLSLSLIAIIALAAACKNEIDNKPAATVTEPTEAEQGLAEKPEGENKEGAADAGALTEVKVDSDSTIAWAAAKVTLQHDGGFEKFTGSFFLTPDNKLSKASFEVDTTSVFSDADMLTDHLKTPDFFDVEKFPTATFESTEVKEGSDVEGYGFTITGNFTIHGVTKGISFPANFTVDGDKVEANSEFTINRKDFEIVYAGKPDDLIKDEVLLKLKFKGTRG